MCMSKSQGRSRPLWKIIGWTIDPWCSSLKCGPFSSIIILKWNKDKKLTHFKWNLKAFHTPPLENIPTRLYYMIWSFNFRIVSRKRRGWWRGYRAYGWPHPLQTFTGPDQDTNTVSIQRMAVILSWWKQGSFHENLYTTSLE